MNICSSLALLLLTNSQKGLVHYFKSQFLDKTFRGLYSPNGFDLALLIPYFIVMVILAGYGMHRYALVYMYYRNRKNKTSESPAKFAELPTVGQNLEVVVRGVDAEDGLYRLSLPGGTIDVGDWSEIRAGELVEVRITGHNKGGLECEVFSAPNDKGRAISYIFHPSFDFAQIG